jgi:hypothetical protein
MALGYRDNGCMTRGGETTRRPKEGVGDGDGSDRYARLPLLHDNKAE